MQYRFARFKRVVISRIWFLICRKNYRWSDGIRELRVQINDILSIHLLWRNSPNLSDYIFSSRWCIAALAPAPLRLGWWMSMARFGPNKRQPWNLWHYLMTSQDDFGNETLLCTKGMVIIPNLSWSTSSFFKSKSKTFPSLGSIFWNKTLNVLKRSPTASSSLSFSLNWISLHSVSLPLVGERVRWDHFCMMIIYIFYTNSSER